MYYRWHPATASWCLTPDCKRLYLGTAPRLLFSFQLRVADYPFRIQESPKSNVSIRMCWVKLRHEVLWNSRPACLADSRADQPAWHSHAFTRAKTAMAVAFGMDSCAMHQSMYTYRHVFSRYIGKTTEVIFFVPPSGFSLQKPFSSRHLVLLATWGPPGGRALEPGLLPFGVRGR